MRCAFLALLCAIELSAEVTLVPLAIDAGLWEIR
jgi:hypothetical protein